MNGYKGPLDIPLISDLITSAVNEFAKDNFIECDLWYHDEPVWLVWEEVKGENFFQQVQIAAFLTGEGERLFFIPQAYSCEEGVRKKTSWGPREITPYPLRDYYIFTSTTPPTLDLEAIIKKVKEQLVLAWKIAKSFGKDDLNI